MAHTRLTLCYTEVVLRPSQCTLSCFYTGSFWRADSMGLSLGNGTMGYCDM